jgi:hypothetical protein
MFYRRLLAGVLVLGAVMGLAVPVSAQKDKDKRKDKDKPKDKGAKVTLTWKFEKDKTFYQKMTTETNQTMKVMNNDVKQTQKQTFYFSWKPTKIEGDKVTIEQEIIGVAMDIDIGGSKINYDSTKEAGVNNPLGDFFKALVGSKFTVTLDKKKMAVTDVDGREEFLKKLVNANPQMKPLLETILSKDALKEMATPTFAVVPDKPVAKGDTWTKDTSLDMGPIGKYENKYKYTYDGVDETTKLHKIKTDTTLTYKAPAESVGQGGLPFKIKSADLKSSNASGSILFNNDKGRVQKTSMKLDLKGKLSIEIGGQVTTVELTQTQESTVETLDENPIPKKK